MQGLLAAFGLWVAGVIASKLLKKLFSVGIGLVTFSVVQTMFDKYLAKFLNSMQFTADLMALMNISKLDVCISIVLGAYTVRAMLIALKVKTVKKE